MKCNSNLASILFFIVCIPVRVYIMHMVKHASDKQLTMFGAIALLIALGFFSIYFFQLRNDTGVETFGCPIWWNNYRPIHGTFYLLTAMYALNKHRCAYIPLLIDVLFSLMIKMFRL